MQYTVGRKIDGKSGHVVVSAEDALEAAVKVKAEFPQALITYVRRTNRRGDARHPPPRSDGVAETARIPD